MVINDQFYLTLPKQLDFAEMCRTIRREGKYSQTQIANFLNISKRTYLSWEYGECIPGGNMAVWIAEQYRNINNFRLSKKVFQESQLKSDYNIVGTNQSIQVTLAIGDNRLVPIDK